jgi:hypothetical protein
LADTEQVIPLLAQAVRVSVNAFSRIVHRIALGSVFTQKAANAPEGLEQLSKYLPYVNFEPGGTDFLYQINRRRRSSHAPHVQVNRLSRWQLEEVHGGLLTVGLSQPPNFRADEQFSVIKLSLDINTAPGSNAISHDRMPGLFDELVSFAREIAIEGDIP